MPRHATPKAKLRFGSALPPGANRQSYGVARRRRVSLFTVSRKNFSLKKAVVIRTAEGRPSDPGAPDLASLGALAAATRLGEVFDDQGWKRTVDRTQWAQTIWFPFALGDRGEPALWPNTPPFFLPSQGDFVCEVSRGESFLNAPDDCPPQCGDGAAQTGETSKNCPGDVRLFQ